MDAIVDVCTPVRGLYRISALLLLSLAPLQVSFPSRACSTPADTKLLVRTVAHALSIYRDEHRQCPKALRSLVDERYLTRLPLDAWGRPLRFECRDLCFENEIEVESAGADGRFGTLDDIHVSEF